jgi:hypothetical protein
VLARAAAVKVSSIDDAASIGVQLLGALKAIFDGDKEDWALDRISSAELVAKLGADVGSPWAEWKNGKPMTQAQLARVLKRFSIYPEDIRFQSGPVLKGYGRVQFSDAWERYLSQDMGRGSRNTATTPVDVEEVDDF